MDTAGASRKDVAPVVYDERTNKRYSFISITMRAVLKVIEQHLNLAGRVEYSFSDNVKQVFKLKNLVSYPRASINVTSMELTRELNAKSSQSGGYASLKDAKSRTGNAIKMVAIHPVKMNFEFHYFDDDTTRMMEVMELLGLMAATRTASYQLKIGDSHLHQSRLDFEDTISIPSFELSNDSNPESCELTIAFSVNTFIGSLFDIARNLDLTVQEDAGAAKINIHVDNL